LVATWPRRLSERLLSASNRGAGLVFGNVLISTGERMLDGVLGFVLHKLTPKAKK
jgi:hypothetical protein